jgi:hypothetical protein
VGQEEAREVQAVRALVQAFEEGAGDGVKDGKGKRKGECHFLASVFANISMVSAFLESPLIADPRYPLPAAYSATAFPRPLVLPHRP